MGSNGDVQQRKDKNKKIVLCFFLVLFLICTLGAIFGGSGSGSATEVEAFVMSQEFAKDFLKSPGTAEFPWITDVEVYKKEEGVFLVNAYVDSQNSFGAMIRNNYTCLVKTTDGGESWSLEAFSFDGR